MRAAHAGFQQRAVLVTPQRVGAGYKEAGQAGTTGRTGQTPSTENHQCGGEKASRRQCLISFTAMLAAAAQCAPAAAMEPAAGSGSAEAAVQALEAAAAQAYADREFAKAVDLLSQIIELQPREPRWREMRAQALVDGKAFSQALVDFEAALAAYPAGKGVDVDRARLLAGRGLAYEGLGDWVSALRDYNKALQLAEGAGQLPDPYVLNSRGNCHASLGEWQKARDNFLASAEGFQRATGYRYGRSTTPRLDGAVFAASNAALMLAQLGDEDGAIKEMQAVARRAPGSVDMRAALAALYWRQGDEGAAESEWDFACNSITVGCSKYQDQGWLYRIRRWPPLMCDYMRNFLSLRSSPAASGA